MVRGLSPKASVMCMSSESVMPCVSFECDSLNAETDERKRMIANFYMSLDIRCGLALSQASQMPA